MRRAASTALTLCSIAVVAASRAPSLSLMTASRGGGTGCTACAFLFGVGVARNGRRATTTARTIPPPQQQPAGGGEDPSRSSPPSLMSPSDLFLTGLASDRTSVLLGSVGLALVVLNRLLTFPEYTDDSSLAVATAALQAARSRADLLAVVASGGLLLNGVSKMDVTSKTADTVALTGEDLGTGNVRWTTTIDDGHSEKDGEGEGGVLTAAWMQSSTSKKTVEWALTSLLEATPARTAVLLLRQTTTTNALRTPERLASWRPVAAAGIVPPRDGAAVVSAILDRTAAAKRVGDKRGGTVSGTGGRGGEDDGAGGPRETYLPTLQAVPGRVEFTYLPSNAQEALALPVVVVAGGEGGAGATAAAADAIVVLGGDAAKSFAPKDVAWCRTVASWVGESFS